MKQKRRSFSIVVAFALAVSVLAVLALPASADDLPQVTLCHATNADKNPYVEITVDAAGAFDGHAGHTGPVWNSTLKANHEKWGDIIPAFDYFQEPGHVLSHYAGQNLTAGDQGGSAILANHCNIPGDVPPPPDPGSLQVTKTVVGTTELTSFTVDVTCDDQPDVPRVLDLVPNVPQTVTGIEAGSSCTVTEAVITGDTVTFTPSDVLDITSGTTTEVTVTNTFAETPVTPVTPVTPLTPLTPPVDVAPADASKPAVAPTSVTVSPAFTG